MKQRSIHYIMAPRASQPKSQSCHQHGAYQYFTHVAEAFNEYSIAQLASKADSTYGLDNFTTSEAYLRDVKEARVQISMLVFTLKGSFPSP